MSAGAGRAADTAQDAAIASGDLIVHVDEARNASLAYRITWVPNLTERWVVVVNAQNGRTLSCFNAAPTGKVTGSGNDEQGISRTLTLWQQGSLYYLCDTGKTMYQPASTPPSPATTQGALIVSTANGGAYDGSMQGSLIASTAPSAGFPTKGVGAAFNISKVYDYYIQKHNRNSMDNAGKTVSVIVDVGFDNACWNGQNLCFGNANKYASATDIVGHEYTHSVTQFTANLTRRPEGQCHYGGNEGRDHEVIRQHGLCHRHGQCHGLHR